MMLPEQLIGIELRKVAVAATRAMTDRRMMLCLLLHLRWRIMLGGLVMVLALELA